MHIVVVGHTRYPVRQPFAGGLESVTWHLARGLAERGHQVSMFAAPGSDELPGVQNLWPDELPLSEAARGDVSMPDETSLRRHHAYLALMLSLADRDDVDLVHTHALHHLPTAMAPGLRVPTVLTLHTPPTPWLESAIRIARSARRGSLLSATAVSDWTARAWAHTIESTVVHNGVDTEVWRPGPGGKHLVWWGRIVPEKAPHLAVRIARAAGMPIVLAGPVADEDYAERELLPLCGEGVTYAGHLRSDELARLVGSSAAAVVTPVWDEPYGLVAAEALACGTPVLAFARGGLPEILDHNVGRLVSTVGTDEEVVARAAALLPEVVSLSRTACRELAVTCHSMDRMIEAYERVYLDVLAGHAEPPLLRIVAPLPAGPGLDLDDLGATAR